VSQGHLPNVADSIQVVLPVAPANHSWAVPAIVVGGVIVAVVDLLYAIVVYSPRQPIFIPQTIASGLLGPQAYSEGAFSCVLGILLHFSIALSAATVYFLASRYLSFLITHAVASGLAYGSVVFAVMHMVVLPLSAVPKTSIRPAYMAIEFVEHLLFVGLPIALSVRHYSR